MRSNPDEHIRYDSIYQGIVSDNADPLFLGRVKVFLGILGPDLETEWLMPNTMFSGPGTGAYWPPEIDDAVHVMFLEGDPEVGIFMGGFWANPDGAPETPTEFQREEPTNRGFKTKSGHLLEFDDLDDTKGIRITSADGFKFHIDEMLKTLVIETPDGQGISFDDENKMTTLTVIDDFIMMIAGSIDLNVTSDWTVIVDGDATIEATNINLTSTADVNIEAGAIATIEGTGQTNLGGSSSITMVNGTLVMLGGGGPGVARLGDSVIGVGNLAAPVVSNIVLGSFKVFSA